MIRCQFPSGQAALLRHATIAAIIVVDQRILLIRRSPESHTEPNKWGLPGGYVDRDETMSESVLREVREETGFQVTHPQPFRIIDTPNRPGENAQNIELSFLFDNAHEVGEHDHEISEVRWWPLNGLPTELAFDHADTIALAREYLEHPEKYSLPFLNQISETKLT